MSGTALRLGRFEDSGQEYLFDSNESLITLARPGRGKSQAHVIRNLLYLEGPAFVLDVKPEIYDATADWRARHVGPVIKFAPAEWQTSAAFNPFDIIPADPIQAYRAIQRLVPLLMRPPDGARANHWEGRGAQFLIGAMMDIAQHNPYDRRDMTAVVDWFSPSETELEDCIARLQASPVRVMQRFGKQVEALSAEPKLFESLRDTTRLSIEVWGSPEVESLVNRTTIDVRDLRRRNGTLYICVTPDELISYASIIRCLFGLTQWAIREDKTAAKLPPVTFFMDEFPQLGFMQELEQMLALGRGSGLRLWLFSQTIGQIRKAYGDENRLLEMMAVRCYMEPTAKLAQELSKELGTYRDIWLNTERPMATPQELSGPEYAEKVIVLEGGRQPARLQRVMAFEDPVLINRLGARR